MTQENAPTLDQLKAQMRVAIEAGDDASVAKLAKSISKHSSDIVKAEVYKLKKEAEAMAGSRERLAISIFKGIPDPVKAELVKAKAKGYTFKLDDGEITYKSVSLLVPTVRKSGGGGGGGTGVTIQSQTGMRRGELIDKYASNEEKATIQAAFDNAKSSPGSAKWGAEKPIVKGILKDHPELIKH